MITFGSSFEGKRILVTGAGKGIGRALAVKLSNLGATVYAVSRTKVDLDLLQKECPNIYPIVLDVSNWHVVRDTLAHIVSNPVDILINNAAIGAPQPFMNVTSDEFDKIIATNLKAVVNISQICAKKMIEKGIGGTIINMSSVREDKPVAGASLYCACKAALGSLTKTMALELGQYGIKVVGMKLGFVWTNIWAAPTGCNDEAELEERYYSEMSSQFPLGKVFIPMDQVMNTILFVASGSVDMMTGNGVIIDGGYCTN